MNREEALDILQNKRTYLSNWTYSAETCGKALNVAINALRSGKWIINKDNLGYYVSECSACGHLFHGNQVLIYKPKYCANCGAEMEGAE